MSIEKIKRRHIRDRITWGLLFFFSIIVEIVCFNIYMKGLIVSLDIALMIFLNLNAVFILLAFLIFIVSFSVRCIYYEVNGREFCVSVGFFKNYLIYNDEIVDSSSSNGFYTPPMNFHGNGFVVEVKSGSFGGVDFKVNNRILKKGESINIDTATSSQNNNDSTIEKLKELNALRNSGALSEEEFQTLKKKLIK